MSALQAACAAIVALYVAVRMARAPDPTRVAARLALLVAASWIGEDSVIRAYGFYHYDRSWALFVDRVPLAIIVIWPVVIDSAWQLARCLVANVRLQPLVAAAFVLADASLIEPIAVRAGLWRWTEPGLFAVPPIGILGWALFAAACVALIEHAGVATLLLAPLATHALLLACWWGGLRWVNGDVAPWLAAATAWAVLAPIGAYIFWSGLRRRVPTIELLVRVPGALFFFVLLASYGRDQTALVTWSFAFAPPYLALLSIGAQSDVKAVGHVNVRPSNPL
ncbi:MAG TPA: carotenoid biosynthesis protein [Polyangia bacterium]|nr:carotenoid biosynthesis protein [Polyangia bacterium]